MITKRLLSIEISLLAGFSTIFLLPHTNTAMPAGIAMTLPTFVGNWVGKDEKVTARELDVLAKDTQFARKTYTNFDGDVIFVSIVMSGDDMASSIHRPERCLPAQGWSVQRSDKTVVPIGNKPLAMTKLHNVHPVQQSDKSRLLVRNLNYYWFVGVRAMTPSHLNRTIIDMRDRILRGEAQRWAYVTDSTNIIEGGTQHGRTEEEATKVIEKFIKELVPELTRPDGTPLL
jgi:EpsI family protein